jgi:hypothetical protein
MEVCTKTPKQGNANVKEGVGDKGLHAEERAGI